MCRAIFNLCWLQGHQARHGTTRTRVATACALVLQAGYAQVFWR
jgi:hypothetical protein